MADERTAGRAPGPGSVVEEAAKLAEAARLWLAARSTRPAEGDVWADATAEEVPTPPECTGCPICSARRRFGQLSPEAYEQLAEAVGSLGKVLRDLGKTQR